MHTPQPDQSPRQSKNFIPQQMTFNKSDVGGGDVFFDETVNKFVQDKATETGVTPLIKPWAGGCTVIYWVPCPHAIPERSQPADWGMEHPNQNGGTIKKAWWPERLRQPVLKGDGRPDPIRDGTKYDGPFSSNI